MHVADEHIEPDAGVDQHLVQPVLLGAEHAHELLPLTSHQPKPAEVHARDERRPQQTRARQRGEPLRVGHVGLATGHRLDVPGIDHPSNDAHRLQRRERALPVHPGALHDHHFGPDLQRPLGQRATVAFERAEVELGHLLTAVVVLDDGAGGDLGLVNVQRDDALVDGGQLHSRLLQVESHSRTCEPAQVLPTNGLPSELGGSI
jgi:hypothetical protein